MQPKIMIIKGSSRKNGNTQKVVNAVLDNVTATFIDLQDHDISYYDYEHKNQGDGFMPIAQQMVAHDVIVFATPVYWYSMSAIMKTFLDRMSDMITIRKDLGRALKGKSLYLLYCSSDEREYEGFAMPFKNTADYLDMDWGGAVHTWVEAEESIPLVVQERLVNLSAQLEG